MEHKSGWSANAPCVDGSPLGGFDWCVCIAGWSGHVSDLCMRHILPLALMPFARSGSRSIARTRSAGAFWVFPFRRFQPAFCINSCLSFPTSLARSIQFSAAYIMSQPDCDSVLRSSSSPRSCARFYWQAQQLRPWPFGAPEAAKARDTCRHNAWPDG